MRELCDRFIDEYSLARNKPSTVNGNRSYIRTHILPAMGKKKVPDVTRADVAKLMADLEDRPSAANHTLSCLRKMFNLAEVWDYRPDGSNPCRHIQKYPERGSTRLIRDGELRRLFDYRDKAEREGLEHPFITLAIRLQFEFAARRSENLALEWDWIDFENRRVVWPDSKTGGMSKPLGAEAYRLLESAPRLEDSPYVVPSIFDPLQPMPKHTYSSGWARIIQRAGVPHCGTHAVRHRAATDIANSGVPVKVGMALTAHKTVTMFMRYVHVEDDPVRQAADAVASRRRGLLGAPALATPSAEPAPSPALDIVPVRSDSTPGTALPALGLEDRTYASRTKLGNYRPYRKRAGPNRTAPPKLASAAAQVEAERG